LFFNIYVVRQRSALASRLSPCDQSGSHHHDHHMTNNSLFTAIPNKTLLKMLSFALPLLVSLAMLFPTGLTQILEQSSTLVKEGRPLHVLPLPTKYSTGNEVVCLSPNWSITFPGLSSEDIPEDLLFISKKTEWHLLTHKYRYLSVERGAEFFTKESGGCKHHISTLEIHIERQHGSHGPIPSIMDGATRPAEERPDLEAYTLSVPTSGPAVMKTTTALGALRGLSTFVNLFYYLPKGGSSSVNQATASVLAKPNILGQSGQLPLGSGGRTDHGQEEQGSGSRSKTEGTTYAPAAPYEIEDKPAFGWRAVMLDTSRNWFGKEAIMKASTLPTVNAPC
jgi:hexosaminidase